MCVEIWIGNEFIGTPGELRPYMPTIIPRVHPDTGEPEEIDDACCLCPVDIEATAAANGYEVEKEDDGFTYNARKVGGGRP